MYVVLKVLVLGFGKRGQDIFTKQTKTFKGLYEPSIQFESLVIHT